MRITTILLLTILFNTTSFAQIDTTVVPFVSYWSKGDSYNFQITKIKKSWQNEVLENVDSTAYKANFLVLDSTATSYKIQWSHQTDLESFEIPEELKQKFQKYQVTNVIYKTSELGEFLEIENWKEISEMMTGLYDDLEKHLLNQPKTSGAKLKESLLPFRRIYTSKQGIEQLVFKELQSFHFLFGLEYSVDEVIEYETNLPNMFGGKPIRADSKLYVDGIDFEEGFCIMVQEMEINEKDTKTLINSLFKKTGLKKSDYKRFLKNAAIEINDFNVFEVFYNPGVPYRIETNRMVNVKLEGVNTSKLETNRIELIFDEE